MNASTMQIITAVIMAAGAIVLFFAYRAYLARSSERRMLKMLEAVGLDPAIASSGDVETIMKEVRDRCRHCAAEDKCERWLEGKEAGENEFCPNARVFEILKKYSGATG